MEDNQEWHKQKSSTKVHLTMLENLILSIHEAERRLRHHFCRELVEAIMLPKENGLGFKAENYFDSLHESETSTYSMPFMNLQMLFSRLGQLNKFGDKLELAVGSCWKVEELSMELMKAVIEWISDKHEQWNQTRTASSAQD